MNVLVKKLLIEAVCAVTSDATTLDIARWWEMKPAGYAAKHLEHYLEGSGKDLTVDLETVLKDDAGVRRKVHTEIVESLKVGRTNGTIAIPQSVYQNKDWHYAIGSMNINWKFPTPPSPGKIHIGFRNEYKWHPNERRITQCVHQAADNLRTTAKAKNYWMVGSADIVPSLQEWGKKSIRFHLVVAGESLSKIAMSYYGSADRWPDIHTANQSKIRNPDRIFPGMVLQIP